MWVCVSVELTRKARSALLMPDHAVASNQLELHEFWVAKIKEIRARSKEDVSGRFLCLCEC
jgi:hypothetical protein